MDNYIVLNPIELPGSRYFREAWEICGDSVKVNIEKAKKIHIDNLRVERNKKLSELDFSISKIKEKPSSSVQDRIDLNQIYVRKNMLRNMPKDTIFDIDDINDLMKAVPNYLR